MSALTEDGKKATAEIAARHGVSPGAAEALLFALVQGQGTQAQFISGRISMVKEVEIGRVASRRL